MFVVHFCSPGSGSGSRDPIKTETNPDPDPQHCLKLLSSLHVRMQVHQLDIILCALDDYSTLLRERLHTMLQVCSLATKVESPPKIIFRTIP
jgi:hypothetical protein